MTTSPNAPLLLEPANFTPRARTPWGGPRLPALKSKLLKGPIDEAIGESWEISVEPDFPSRLDDGSSLEDALSSAPEAMLGRGRRSLELLVKLLDAAAPLSVQIHPRSDDPSLGPAESGKPEAWYVVDHLEGAGVYFGLEEGVDREALRRAVEEADDVSRLLRFHPVRRGDFFLVEPGVPHAVGPGVFLVEPQRVQPGKRGMTYRYWDWNRLYDAEGREAVGGAPRALHLDRALEVTDFDRPRGGAFDAAVKRSLGEASRREVRFEPLSGLPGGLPSRDLIVGRLSGNGVATLPDLGVLLGLTVVRGAARWSADSSLEISAGRSAVVPAGLRARELELAEAEIVVSAVP